MDISQIQTRFNDLSSKYDALFDETADLMELNETVIKTAIKDQISLEMQWELMAKKFNHLYDQCELEVDSSYSDAVRDAMSDKYKEVTFTEAKVYAKANPAYRTSVSLLNDVRHIRDECKGLVETVKSRKYLLNNLTNLIVASSENHIL